ncbi:MAG: ABC transporter permease [Phycisphaerales bacterium]|nr:ABC transporter permease [Phycisphaerales bacterium]
MYQFLLTSRYLTSRIIPVLAVAAVALCVALVIVVVSVMTGFLDMVRDSGRTLMGDVVISYPVVGIPWYDDLIEEIEALPEAAAAAPLVDTIGVLRMPYPEGAGKEPKMVQIWGVDPGRFAKVTTYADTLMWPTIPEAARYYVARDRLYGPVAKSLDRQQKIAILRASGYEDTTSMSDGQVADLATALTQPEWIDHLRTVVLNSPDVIRKTLREDQLETIQSAVEAEIENDFDLEDNYREDGLTMRRNGQPGMVAGIHVSDANYRDSEGQYKIGRNGHWWLPRFQGALTTIPVDASGGTLEPETEVLPFLNEFSSGVFPVDESRVMLPIEVAQRLMHLDEAEIVDDLDPTKVVGVEPARATMILVRGQPGVEPLALRERVREAYRAFVTRVEEAHPDGPRPPREGINFGLNVLTWEEQNAAFIGPVEKERALMRTLFSIVYVVCAALVLAIFWAIVYEKTRDIGILRSIGASRPGIVWIFMLYGLVVGVVGAFFGLLLGWLVTSNVNGIHDMLAEPPEWLAWGLAVATAIMFFWTVIKLFGGRILPVVLGVMGTLVLGVFTTLIFLLDAQGGLVIWDPAVYYFTEVPNDIDVPEAIITMIGAVIFSLVGAAIPAARAADIDPVRALRYE